MAVKKKQHPVTQASLDALKPTNFKNISKERGREVARMGAKATNEKKRIKKTFREVIEALGMSQATDREKDKFVEMFPNMDPNDVAKIHMIVASMYNQAVNRGNVRAAEFLRDSAGEKPTTIIDGTIATEKIFVTKEDEKNALEHIAGVIADDGNGD